MSYARIRPAELSLSLRLDAGGGSLKQPCDQHSPNHSSNSIPIPSPNPNPNPNLGLGNDDQRDQQYQQYQQHQQHQQHQQQHQHQQQKSQQSIAHSDTRDNHQSVTYCNPNSSSSDLVSPVTPTFSPHGSTSHLRYTSSTSSLDLQATASSTCSDSPASPAQPCSHNATATSSTKRQLPDVQEDPLEREAEDPIMTSLSKDQLDSLYDCLCDSPCPHQTSDMVQSADWTHSIENEISYFDYDMGFLSDGDTDPTLHPTKSRNGAESPLVGLTIRLGSRFPTLSRWRSTRRRNRAFTAASESSLEHPPALSRATSTSRSSSLSAPSRRYLDRANEPPLPETPAISFYEYESTDSIPNAVAIDIDKANVRESLERDRELTRTPLLPPLLTDAYSVSSQAQSQQPSPLQSPTVAPSELNSPVTYATPPLSTKPSFSSFRPPLLTSLSSPVVATSEVVVTIPNLLEQHDAWSDRLGHANYTILPRPYQPESADLNTLRTLRADWDLARINYTKHIVRTGEHYGTTSKTYALTEAKWAETEREWKAAHEALLDYVAALNPGNESQLRWDRLQDDAPAAVPRMLDAEGKFPDLGDEDIVGPMVRDAFMAREPSSDAENSAKKFWKSLVGKVGLKK